MQDMKCNLMSVGFRLREYAVFTLTFGADANPMLSQAAEHVLAFADIDSLIVDANFVNARVFKPISPAIAF